MADVKCKLRAEHVRINRQGYDSGGQYWGVGPKLYRVEREDPREGRTHDVFVRAPNAKEAKVIASRHFDHSYRRC